MDLALFKRLVTEALEDIVPNDFVGDGDSIYPEIRAHLGSTETWTLLNGLKTELIVRWICHQEDPTPYLSFIAVLLDAARGHLQSSGATTNWAAIIGIVAANKKRIHWFSMPLQLQLRPEDKNVALGAAAKTLLAAGYRIEIDHTKIGLSEADEQAVGKRILELCQRIGGVALADAIYRTIQPHYNATTRRYHLIRTVSLGTHAVAAQVPWGYLYQLAVKYLNRPASSIASQDDRVQLVELTKAVFALYGLQPYNFWEGFHLDRYSLLPYLQRAALYDATFSLPQLCGQQARLIAHGVAGNLHDQQRQGTLPLKSALRLADQLLKLSKPNEAVFITARQLSSALNTRKELIDELLQRVFSHAPDTANQKLTFPPQSTAIDSWFCPLIRMADSRYYLPPRSLAAPGLLEALLKLSRESIDHFEKRHLGPRAEQFVIAEFNRRGVTTHHGKYAFPKTPGHKLPEGECDLVVQTDTHILFFEMKSKPLTRKARNGDDIDILLGLSKSLVDSQLQIMKHEKVLRDQGRLVLLDSTDHLHTVPWNGRQVERISVGLHDYASLQDRMILQRFLQACSQGDFGHPDEQYRSELKKLSAQLVELRELASHLGEFDASKHSPFFSSWFLSVPQLLLLLEASVDNESFKKQLWRHRHVLTGSLDFYAEYAFHDQLRPS